MESAQSSELSEDELEKIERWFVRQGLPNLIDEYSVKTDVFNRAVPVLVVLWMFSVLGAYGDKFEGWRQAYAALGAGSILLVVGVSVNVLSGRPALKVPARVGYIELAIFVVTPALLPVLLRTGGVGAFLIGLAGGVFELCLVWFVYGFGLGHILRWAVIHLVRQISSVLALMIRSLPLLLLFTMFLFLNAELWQVAQDFTTPLFFVAAGGLLAVAFLFRGVSATTRTCGRRSVQDYRRSQSNPSSFVGADRRKNFTPRANAEAVKGRPSQRCYVGHIFDWRSDSPGHGHRRGLLPAVRFGLCAPGHNRPVDHVGQYV